MPYNTSAIDLGFLYTKAIINGKRVIMKSVVGDSTPLMFESLSLSKEEDKQDHIKCRVGTQDYFVSDLAMRESSAVMHSLKGDRFDSDVTEVLIKSAFGLGIGSDHVEHNIVSGLPVSHFSQYKSNIQSLFLGNNGGKIHNFDVHNKNKSIRGSVKLINGQFIPQPFGAAMDRLLDDNGQIRDEDLAKKTVTVIDPGFGTTDIFTIRRLQPVGKLSFSTRTAMNHAYSLIGQKIEEKFGVYKQLYELEEVVRNREFRQGGKVFDMSQLIDWAYKATAQQLVSEITNKLKSSMDEIDHYLVSGGGGLALYPWLAPNFNRNIELLEDPQWSVVSGYYKWGVRSFG